MKFFNSDILEELEHDADVLRSKHPEYETGLCHVLAIALHEKTGLPLGAIIDYDPNIKSIALVHAFVFYKDNFATMLDMFPTFDPDVIEIEEKKLVRLGGEFSSTTLSEARGVADKVLHIFKRQVDAGYLEFFMGN